MKETNCVFSYKGRDYTANGAWVEGGRALLYAYERTGEVGNWDGSVRVKATFGGTWQGNMGDTRQSVSFTWDGESYSGVYFKSGSDLVRARRVLKVTRYVPV